MTSTPVEAQAMLSVCMATWNGARFVGAQLASILPQLGPGDEVVVSDDRSTDGTVEVVRSFGDPRVRVTEGPAVKSAMRNFEHALGLARGDIIALSDQDDVWHPGRVARLRERLAARRTPVHLVSLDARVTDEAGRVTEESLHARIGARPGLLRNVWNNRYVGATLGFTRELLELALPFPAGLPMHDMWLGLLAELHGGVEFVPGATMDYRRHGGAVTDFRIAFRPLTQIRRRANLAWNLARRSLGA